MLGIGVWNRRRMSGVGLVCLSNGIIISSVRVIIPIIISSKLFVSLSHRGRETNSNQVVARLRNYALLVQPFHGLQPWASKDGLGLVRVYDQMHC